MVAQGIPEIGSYIAFLFVSTVALVIILRLFVSPRDPRPTPGKKKPFESGQITAGPGRTRFIIQYYPYLLMFVVYNVIAMFLFAWGVNLRALAASGSVPVFVSIIFLLIPFGDPVHPANH